MPFFYLHLIHYCSMNQWCIQRVFDAGIPVWLPKLCAQINEKELRKNLINSNLWDKIFIAIVSKHCKKFNFTLPLFFKKINQNSFHVIFRPVFTSNFKLGLLCILCIVIDFDGLESFLGFKLSTQGTFRRV